jgi:hypothetical protein
MISEKTEHEDMQEEDILDPELEQLREEEMNSVWMEWMRTWPKQCTKIKKGDEE